MGWPRIRSKGAILYLSEISIYVSTFYDCQVTKQAEVWRNLFNYGVIFLILQCVTAVVLIPFVCC